MKAFTYERAATPAEAAASAQRTPAQNSSRAARICSI